MRARVHTQFLSGLAAIYKEGHILWVCNIVRPNQISVLFTDLIVLVIFSMLQHKAAGLIKSAQS